jgi:hypothetical protein
MTTTIRSRRALLSTALIGGAATVVVIGLLTSQSFSAPEASINEWVVSEYDAAPEPTTSAIVPSPVIETNVVFFFGCGDGSNGYYAERPKSSAN